MLFANKKEPTEYSSYSIAVLISCYNRKEKTLSCIESLFSQINFQHNFTVYLIDNGIDGTGEKVRENFPEVNIFSGNDSLYWASSMRKLWQIVINTSISYDFYLLLNDDTILINEALSLLIQDFKLLGLKNTIIIGSAMDPITKEFSYGGRLLVNRYNSLSKKVLPNGVCPQICHLGNGNIMFIPNKVFNKLGLLSESFSHGLADFDYTMRARKVGIQTFISSRYIGMCKNDHGNNWWPAKQFTLKQRIDNLYSVKGLAYTEYIIYLKRHFPYYLTRAWFQLWAKTFFPFFWEKFKKEKNP